VKNGVFHINRRKLIEVFGNTVLSSILGLKQGEVTEGWTELHDEALYNLNTSPSIKLL
jgi:hypothetical protein